MGNDGGSIPTRRELVREAARAPTTAQISQTRRELQSHFWTTCPLSHKPLTRPIVADYVGNLYNKDAILQFLLSGDGDTENGISPRADCEVILCGRVRSLRDVVELKFEVDPERRTVATEKDDSRESWVCPITAKQLGPAVKSVYLVPCGHVFAEEAVRQLGGDKCLQCDEPYSEDNVIPILPQKEADKQRLLDRSQNLAEQGLTHSLKKAPGSKKKRKNTTVAAGEPPEVITSDASKDPTKLSVPSNRPSRSNTSTPTPTASTGIKNAATALLTARVLEEENERKKRQKMIGKNGNLSSLFTKSTSSRERKHTAGDFMTRGYTIPADDSR